MEAIKKKRIIIDTDPELHKRVKLCATRRNLSIRQYVTRALWNNIKEDEKYYE